MKKPHSTSPWWFKSLPWVWMALVWLVFAAPYVFGNLLPFPSAYLVDFFPPWNNVYGLPVKNAAMPDVISQIFPWKTIAIDAWKAGQVPRWNPYSFSGNPLLAGVQAAVFNPINALYLVLPFADAWSVSILLQPLLSGIFMYLMLRTFGTTRTSGLIGAVSFSFAGFMTVWMAYGTIGYAILTLPLVLMGIQLFFRTGRVRFAALVTSGVAWSLFSGHFQTSLYLLIVSVGFLIWSFVNSRQWMRLWWSVVALISGIAIALPQVLPAVHFYQQAVRSELYEKGGVIFWNYLPTVMAPDFYGNPVTRNDWYGYYAEWSSYAGVIPLLLSIIAVIATRNDRRSAVWFFFIAAVLSLSIAYPTPVGDALLYLKVPVLSTSTFSRVIVVFSFAVSALSAFGYDALVRLWQRGRVAGGSVMAAVAIPALWLGFLWLAVLTGGTILHAGMTPDGVAIARRNLLLPSAFLFAGGGLAIGGFFTRQTGRFIICAVLVLLTSGEMLRYSTKWMPFEPREYVYPDLPVLRFLRDQAGTDRVFGNIGNEAISMTGLYGIEGYDPLYIRRYGEFMTAAHDGTISRPSRSVVNLDKGGRYTKRILNLLGVRYHFHSIGDGRNIWAFPFWDYPESYQDPVYRDEWYEVFENRRALPRFYLTKFYTVRSGDQEIIDRLFMGPEDDAMVVLEQEIPGMMPTDDIVVPPAAVDPVKPTSYMPNRITFAIESGTAALLYLSDAYYPGWSATVNGQAADILRANYAFRAVPVPTGRSDIELRYEHWMY